MTASAAVTAEIPPVFLAATIDLDRAVSWLADTNARRTTPDRLLMGALFLCAVARSLRDVPELNASWIDGCARPNAAVRLGIAVARRARGEVVPVLLDAERRSLDDLMRWLRDVVLRARTDRLRSDELGDPTFTVTNLGELGVQEVFPSVVPPQVGSIGFGKVVEQPTAVGGVVVCGPVVTATLAAAHRAVGSHRGAHFLGMVDRMLQHPEAL